VQYARVSPPPHRGHTTRVKKLKIASFFPSRALISPEFDSIIAVSPAGSVCCCTVSACRGAGCCCRCFRVIVAPVVLMCHSRAGGNPFIFYPQITQIFADVMLSAAKHLSVFIIRVICVIRG
jgi:hypothetical protein